MNYRATLGRDIKAKYRPDEETLSEEGPNTNPRHRGSHKKIRARAPHRITKRNKDRRR